MNGDQELIEAYLDRELTPAEQDRLAGWLAEDPGHVRRFVRETHLHRQIRDVMLAQPYRAHGLSEAEAPKTKKPSAWSLRDVIGHFLDFPSWPRPQRTVAAFAACLLVVTALGLWCFGPTVGEAEIQGTGLSLERAGQAIAAPAGTHFQPGDVLRTPATASAVISFGPEKTRLTLAPGSELKLAGLSHGKRFDLHFGKLEASVARQRPFSPMVLRTPQTEARVLGTRFTLAITNGGTRLEVTEGKVRLTRLSDGKAVKVVAGTYAVAAANTELRALPLTGHILWQYRTNVPGSYFIAYLLLDPRFPDHPTGRTLLDRFEAPRNWGTNYGSWICGYLHPPVTGKYTFWVAAHDGADFLLSWDDKPEHKRAIANADSTGPREWTRHRGQQSSAVTLVAGRRYYIEALHKQSTGDDHLAVAWEGPGRSREVIPGQFLSPPDSIAKGQAE